MFSRHRRTVEYYHAKEQRERACAAIARARGQHRQSRKYDARAERAIAKRVALESVVASSASAGPRIGFPGTEGTTNDTSPRWGPSSPIGVGPRSVSAGITPREVSEIMTDLSSFVTQYPIDPASPSTVRPVMPAPTPVLGTVVPVRRGRGRVRPALGVQTAPTGAADATQSGGEVNTGITIGGRSGSVIVGPNDQILGEDEVVFVRAISLEIDNIPTSTEGLEVSLAALPHALPARTVNTIIARQREAARATRLQDQLDTARAAIATAKAALNSTRKINNALEQQLAANMENTHHLQSRVMDLTRRHEATMCTVSLLSAELTAFELQLQDHMQKCSKEIKAAYEELENEGTAWQEGEDGLYGPTSPSKGKGAGRRESDRREDGRINQPDGPESPNSFGPRDEVNLERSETHSPRSLLRGSQAPRLISPTSPVSCNSASMSMAARKLRWLEMQFCALQYAHHVLLATHANVDGILALQDINATNDQAAIAARSRTPKTAERKPDEHPLPPLPGSAGPSGLRSCTPELERNRNEMEMPPLPIDPFQEPPTPPQPIVSPAPLPEPPTPQTAPRTPADTFAGVEADVPVENRTEEREQEKPQLMQEKSPAKMTIEVSTPQVPTGIEAPSYDDPFNPPSFLIPPTIQPTAVPTRSSSKKPRRSRSPSPSPSPPPPVVEQSQSSLQRMNSVLSPRTDALQHDRAHAVQRQRGRLGKLFGRQSTTGRRGFSAPGGHGEWSNRSRSPRRPNVSGALEGVAGMGGSAYDRPALASVPMSVESSRPHSGSREQRMGAKQSIDRGLRKPGGVRDARENHANASNGDDSDGTANTRAPTTARSDASRATSSTFSALRRSRPQSIDMGSLSEGENRSRKRAPATTSHYNQMVGGGVGGVILGTAALHAHSLRGHCVEETVVERGKKTRRATSLAPQSSPLSPSPSPTPEADAWDSPPPPEVSPEHITQKRRRSAPEAALSSARQQMVECEA